MALFVEWEGGSTGVGEVVVLPGVLVVNSLSGKRARRGREGSRTSPIHRLTIAHLQTPSQLSQYLLSPWDSEAELWAMPWYFFAWTMRASREGMVDGLEVVGRLRGVCWRREPLREDGQLIYSSSGGGEGGGGDYRRTADQLDFIPRTSG